MTNTSLLMLPKLAASLIFYGFANPSPTYKTIKETHECENTQ